MPLWLLSVFGFLGKLWAVVWAFLKLAITIPLGIIVAALLAGFALGSCHASDRYKAGYAKGEAHQKKLAAKAAKTVVKAQTRITTKAEKQAVQTQTKIEIRYRTLREKVPYYVPLHTAPGVIGAGDFVPASTVLLLDAAVRGDEPEPLSVSSGQSYELASPFRFDQLVDNYVVNLKVGHQNTEQLTGLQGWVREQEALNTPP